MAVLAIFEPDLRVSAQLTGALAGVHDVVPCSTWTALQAAVESSDVELCLVPSSQPDRDGATSRIVQLRAVRPGIGVVVSVEGDVVEDVFDLGGLGVDGVVDPRAPAGRVRADMDAALAAVRARRVEQMLAERLPYPGPAAFAWATEHADEDAGIERFAAALGFSSSGLRDALQDAGLPAPARLLLWGRLILAGARLGDDARTVEDVAFSLGYSTATSLARAMRLHTELTPVEIARAGGMRAVVDALVPPSRPSGGSSAQLGMRPAYKRVGVMVLFALSGCVTLGGGGVDGAGIRNVLETDPIDQLHVGVFAVDLESGRTLFSHNAHRKFIPASNQKILVTATAMSLLGPEHRLTTEVWATGPIHGSVVDGDVVVFGSGDPTFSDRYWSSGSEALRAMADSLHVHGVRHVAGALVVDVAAWDSSTVGPTWEVEDLRYRYASTGGAFAIDEGEIEVAVRGGQSVGDAPHVSWSPLGTHDFVRSTLKTVPADSATRVRPDYLPESRRLVLRGSAREGVTDTVTIAMRDPVRQATAALAHAIDDRGVEVEGGWRVAWPSDDGHLDPCSDPRLECSEGELLFAMASPPLSEISAGILEPSQNWMTEQVVRALGARYGDEGSWEEGIDVVEAYLVNEVGVRPSDIAPRDGSGLSFYNLVTPRALVRVLREMHQMPWGADFRDAMAEPGEDGSTLSSRLSGLEGRVFAKTGTISNVNSLSGYLVRENGQEIAFSILTNGSGLPATRVRPAIDAIVRHLAR